MLSHCGGTQFIRAPRSASGARFDGNYWPDKVFSIVNGIATDNSDSALFLCKRNIHLCHVLFSLLRFSAAQVGNCSTVVGSEYFPTEVRSFVLTCTMWISI